MTQQGDVKLFQTDDGGDIEVDNGVVAMSGGLETAVYLSLFGGNEDDDGRADSMATWWGNLSETQSERKYVSETQYLLRSIPAISSNLKKIEDAVTRDLKWVKSQNIASSISADVVIIGLNRVKITVTIEANGRESEFKFVANWKSTK